LVQGLSPSALTFARDTKEAERGRGGRKPDSGTKERRRRQGGPEPQQRGDGPGRGRGKPSKRARSTTRPSSLNWLHQAWLPSRRPPFAKATEMSTSAAAKVRAGRRVPHPRHWAAALAALVGVELIEGALD
jgi:hypothetical protein